MQLTVSEAGQIKRGRSPVTQIPSPYVGGTFAHTPKIIVIHFTYGGTARSSAEWFRDPTNRFRSSAHAVIDRDGSVIQCVPLNKIAHHAGRSRWGSLVGLNRYAIGIELANWGYLKSTSTGWCCHTGNPVPSVHLAVHRNGNPDGSSLPIGWEPYPDAQWQAAVELAATISESFGIQEIVGHDDISPGRKWDPGPAFEMHRFREAVFGNGADQGDVRMEVVPEAGLYLRAGAGTQFAVIELLPKGSLVEPLSTDGLWLSVSALDDRGRPRATGWVHSRYLREMSSRE